MQKTRRFGARSVPLALLLLCILAYGPFLPRLGFYWDDWPWIWLSHLSGPGGMLAIDRLYRPLAGEILWLGSMLAGKSALGWQILNLVYRWITSVTLFWALRQIWPGQIERPAWIACLFLVYPGFEGQFVSINSSRHILPMGLFFLSLGFMARATQVKPRRLLFTGVALLFSLITMLSTDYYYGLELIRPVVLWLVITSIPQAHPDRLKEVLKHWLPYLLLAVTFFAARFYYLKNALYPVTITDSLSSDPLRASGSYASVLGRNLWLSSVEAWGKVLRFPLAEGPRILAYEVLLVLAVVLLISGYLLRLRDCGDQGRIWRQLCGLGLSAMLVGSLPFLATDLKMGLAFPADRTLLPMIFGTTLLGVGLIDGGIRWRTPKVFIISIAVGLAVGVHFQSGLSFYRDWIHQAGFFRELAWRVPALKPGTALFAQELRKSYSTDNSWTAPLNWIYAPAELSEDLPVMMFYLDLRLKTKVPGLKKALPIATSYAGLDFIGSTDNALVIYHKPPACLRVLHPKYDARNPQLTRLLSQALRLSDLDVISPSPASPAELPGEIFGSPAEAGWCYYFEKADLARQLGDWRRVVEIGDLALQLGYSPYHPAEWAPFIQGYAYEGRWEQAKELTSQAFKDDARMAPMLCDLWKDINQNTAASQQRDQVLESLIGELSCVSP